MVSGTKFATVTFRVHGIGGIWAAKMINPDGADSLLYGNPLQLRIQTKAVIKIMVSEYKARVASKGDIHNY
jgi:hypothetical protein